MYTTTICSQQNGLLQCSQPPGVHLTVDEMAANISTDTVVLHSPLLLSLSLPEALHLPLRLFPFPLPASGFPFLSGLPPPLSLSLKACVFHSLPILSQKLSPSLCLPSPTQTLSLTFQLSHRPTSETMVPHSQLHSHIQSQMTW